MDYVIHYIDCPNCNNSRWQTKMLWKDIPDVIGDKKCNNCGHVHNIKKYELGQIHRRSWGELDAYVEGLIR